MAAAAAGMVSHYASVFDTQSRVARAKGERALRRETKRAETLRVTSESVVVTHERSPFVKLSNISVASAEEVRENIQRAETARKSSRALLEQREASRNRLWERRTKAARRNSLDAAKPVEAKGNSAMSMLQMPWLPPNPALAVLRRNAKIYKHGVAPICCRATMHGVDSMGPNVSLYFRLVRSMTITLGLMFFFLLPSIFLASAGERVPPERLDAMLLSRSSLANVGPPEQSLVRLINATTACPARSLPVDLVPHAHLLEEIEVGGVVSSATNVALGFAALEAIACALLLTSTVFLRFRVTQARKKDAAVRLSVKDYSVMLLDLPADVCESELRVHFSRRYDLAQGRRFHHCCLWAHP